MTLDKRRKKWYRSLPVRGAWVEMRTSCCTVSMSSRRSPCGERGLKCVPAAPRVIPSGRSPCGERGLKYLDEKPVFASVGSLPVRGAWVEMGGAVTAPLPIPRRSPCGERGLKSFAAALVRRRPCRSPCGERGLKCPLHEVVCRLDRSLPVRGAWVEIRAISSASRAASCRSPCGERGLKFRWAEAQSATKPCRSPCGERGLK